MLDERAIRKKIPHRYPFLLLDRVTELSETRALGQKYVTINEPYFRGHFPQAPVVPGVMVLESLMQLAWVLFSEQGGVRLRKIKRLKFRRSILPGDLVELEVQRGPHEDGLEKLRLTARREGKVAVEGDVWVITGDAREARTSSPIPALSAQE
jgi:3-hydroxyacyl-[acyl-carrier-protein] dehydratase